MELKTYLDSVMPLDEAAMNAARERQAQLAKPPGSLGRMEDLSVQLAGITGSVHNKIEKKHLLVFAADNGVVEEGVSSAPQSVTLMQPICPWGSMRRQFYIYRKRNQGLLPVSDSSQRRRLRLYPFQVPSNCRTGPKEGGLKLWS